MKIHRCFATIVLALFACTLLWPMLASMIKLDAALGNIENRELAQMPPLPRHYRQVADGIAQTNAYINDHFPLRAQMIEADGHLKYRLFSQLPGKDLYMGANGRMFVGDIPYLCGETLDLAHSQAIAKSLSLNIRRSRPLYKTHVAFVVVPTAAVIYPEDLPGWLHRICQHNVPAAEKIMQHVTVDTQALLYYPKNLMLAHKAQPAYYKHFFHWYGAMPGLVVDELLAGKFGLSKQQTLPVKTEKVVSDISSNLAGMQFYDWMPVPDLDKANVDYCEGIACFPALRGRLRGLSPYRQYVSRQNPGQRRLLIISDSFGGNLSVYATQYYRQIWSVPTNYLEQTSDSQLAILKSAMRDFAADDLLFVIHDGNMTRAMQAQLMRLLDDEH